MLKNAIRSAIAFAAGWAFFAAIGPHVMVLSGDWLQYLTEDRYFLRRPIYHMREPGGVLAWQACAWGSHGLRGLRTPKAPVAAPKTAQEPKRKRGATLNLATYKSDYQRLRAETAARRQKAMFLTRVEARRGFGILGPICGGVFAIALVGLLRELGPGGPLRAGMAAAVVVASSVSWNFMGQVEFYGPIYAALPFYYWMAIRYFKERSFRNYCWLMVAAFIALNMHRVAIFHLPALLLIFWEPHSRRRFRLPTRPERAVILFIIIATCAMHIIPMFLFALGKGPFLIIEDYNWAPELITPLTEGWKQYVYDHSKGKTIMSYLFGSRLHLSLFFGFMALSAPFGAPVCLLLRRHIRTAEERFLAVAAILAWIWALFWHAHLKWDDWDLFANPAVPTNILAATLVMRTREVWPRWLKKT